MNLISEKHFLFAEKCEQNQIFLKTIQRKNKIKAAFINFLFLNLKKKKVKQKIEIFFILFDRLQTHSLENIEIQPKKIEPHLYQMHIQDECK